jgi:LPXTG-site transpeptidase (sortase) family protein
MANKTLNGTENLYSELGISDSHDPHAKPAEAAAPGLLPVVDLPIAPQIQEQMAEDQSADASKKHETPEGKKAEESKEKEKEEQKKEPVKLVKRDKETNTVTFNVTSVFEQFSPSKVFKTVLPYLAIFLTLLFFYLVVFTNFSITGFFSDITPDKPQQTAQAQEFQVPREQVNAYNTWIHSYFFDVTDPKIVDPNTDLSGNGLTNYQKFLLGLNPKRADSMGLGISDTEALMEGIDPLTGKPMTEDQKKQVASIIDFEGVANKLALKASNQASQVAGANTTENRAEVQVDTNFNAELDIPRLNLKIPLIFSKTENSLLTDLQNGVVHYPGTALPGEIGTSYISGHSSNFAWAKGNYNRVFEKLNDLQKYDSISIKATDVNGKPVTFHYVVTAKDIFKPDDQRQFASIGKSTIGLSTCWPIGTSSKRLVVFAQLSQIDK